MNPGAVLYDAEARPVCDACSQRADLLATDRRAADNIRKAGYGCLAAGMFALVAPIAHVGLLVACVILAATSGVYVLQSLARGNERFTRHLTPWQRQLAWACTIVGLALTALSVLGANFAHVLFG
jgi:Flp pilus assembly protein TadB